MLARLRFAWVECRLPGFLLAGLAIGLAVTLPSAPREAAAGARRGLAVATEVPRATREAMAVLEDGKQPGNAVDAAVVAALVAGVAGPSSSGIGGGGFVNYWDAKERRSTILDFREVAPATLDAQAFEARPFSDAQRGRAVGVPGEVAGLYELHRRYGKLDWATLVGRAALVAERGFSVSPHLGASLGRFRDSIASDSVLAAQWLPGGKAHARGDWVSSAALGRTLRLIAERGPKGLYEGAVAAEIVATANAHGASMTLDDLAAYKVQERAPLEVSWRGYSVHTMPAPSAGGFTLAHVLQLYRPEELSQLGFGTPAYAHALGEAFRAAIADRLRYFGDPAHETVDVAGLLNAERLAARRRTIALDRTHALPRFSQYEQGTHHFVVRDAQGNVVSLTTTVNSAFGAALSTPTTGVLLNDELNDFTRNTDAARLGLEQSPNRARPLARPVSSMTPTIVSQDGEAVLALGGSGGMNIATDVAQALLHALLFDATPEQVVSAPRIQVPLGRASLRVKKSVGSAFIADLEQRGEVVQTYERTTTAVQLLRVRGGVVSAAADPQKHGEALLR